MEKLFENIIDFYFMGKIDQIHTLFASFDEQEKNDCIEYLENEGSRYIESKEIIDLLKSV